MAIIVEDGSIVANANSFASEQEVRDFALARGVTLPGDATHPSHLLMQMMIQVMDYLNTIDDGIWIGTRVSTTQPLPFPRVGVQINRRLVPSNTIPKELKDLQAAMVVMTEEGTDIWDPERDSPLGKLQIGPIQAEFEAALVSAGPANSHARSLMRLLTRSASILPVRVVRGSL